MGSICHLISEIIMELARTLLLKNGPEETTSILPFILIIGW